LNCFVEKDKEGCDQTHKKYIQSYEGQKNSELLSCVLNTRKGKTKETEKA
jgi:hypothetical protein